MIEVVNIIIFSDVFGITPALIEFKEQLGANTIVDPYKGKIMDFISESEAYSYFISKVGFDSYVSKVLKIMALVNCETTVIGFSIGASAIWRSSESNNNNRIKQAFCFYGSQIRNFTLVNPCYKINMVFPKSELHFDVTELIKTLEEKRYVKIKRVDYFHGYMNSNSINFNPIGYKDSVEILRKMIS
jgi:dienelactone hydrolase